MNWVEKNLFWTEKVAFEDPSEILFHLETGRSQKDEKDFSEGHRKHKVLVVLISTIILMAILALLAILRFVKFDQGHPEGLFVCDPHDADCIALLCPQGMKWDQNSERCLIPEGYECHLFYQKCHLFYQKICFLSEELSQNRNTCLLRMRTAGTSPWIKKMCGLDGRIWIEREGKGRCIRTG